MSSPAFVKVGFSLALALCAGCVSARALAADPDPDSEADNYAKGWVRLDADRVGLQAWGGTTLNLGSLQLATDLLINQAYPGVVDPLQNRASARKSGDNYRAPTFRLEAGPALDFDALFVLPKLGLGYDAERKKLGPLVPQLMLVLQGGPLYVESWSQFFFFDMFDKGSQDSYYARDLLLVAINNHFAVGPQAELTLGIHNSPAKRVRSLPVGATLNYSPCQQLVFGLFVAGETQKSAWNSAHDFLAGRVTASYLW